ncbi:pilin [Candidatus Parcubacteria bacterium]|nr:pilin [Candidatus Parcubacteria bacterium]
MKKIILSVIALVILVLPSAAIAQSVDINRDVCRNAPATRVDPTLCRDRVGNSKDPKQNPIYGPNSIVTKAVNILSMVVGVAAVIFIIVGGFRYIISGSNPEEVNKAREYIIYALVALILVAVAQLIIRYALTQID